MTNPLRSRREAQPLDFLNSGELADWDIMQTLMMPQRPAEPEPLTPKDKVARALAMMASLPEGREIIEWLMDITLRLPRSHVGATLEQTAMNAAIRQGIDAVGEAILAAINHGKALERREQEKADAKHSGQTD